MTKQYVYLVRYGLTDPPLIETVGNYDSDIHEPIGVEHAQAIANFLLDQQQQQVGYDGTNNNNNAVVVYSDPFLRCTHTANIIATTLGCPHRIEEGVTEWMVPSLLVDKDGTMTKPRTVQELRQMFPSIMDSYVSVNPVHEKNGDNDDDHPSPGAPQFEESEQALFQRVACTLERLFDHHHNSRQQQQQQQQQQSTDESLVIVSHAPCLQGMALALEGKSDPAESSFGPWSLGGITCFSRDMERNGSSSYTYGTWKCEFYSRTDHMPGEYKDGIKGAWSLPSFVRKQ
ncbi:histidine phosphatase superfamily protein [Nitzschia inconspicua]|uniref:Histidine phosphatase superfamily protein n=1 Tax=Nitzschia inconspicua TaxID=303405 RepID=A0A9K3LGZ5_9STRA|nr:histidine phosphatase superfamily protein [Nitzschia inconspicua]